MKTFAFVALACSGCLSIEADIEESCVARHDVQIDGASASSISQAILVDDLSDVHRLLDYNAELEFVRADVRPTSGVTDLAFVRAATVAIENTPVYACDGDCPSDTGIALLAAAKQRATPYLAANELTIQLTVDGVLPTSAWSVDVDVCVRGTASYSVTP